MPDAGRRQVVTVASALALLGATLALLIYTEPMASRFWFAVAVTVAMASAVAFLSRRLLFSSVVAFSLVALVLLVSLWKKTAMNMVLHSYDLFFYLNAGTLEFLWGDYRSYVAGAVGVLVAAAALAVLAWRFDTTRCFRLASGLALVLAVGAAIRFEPEASADSGGFNMFNDDSSFVSLFYLSWGETYRTLNRGQFITAAAHTALHDFAASRKCVPAAKPPHILLIHQESLVQPSLFPTLAYDHALDPFFLSSDGRLHKLLVETYGGGSWVTEFALLSGVSTKAFGDMRMFVQVFMEGRLKETLPQVLEGCGYRTLMLFPMDKGFLSLDRFYRSIGFSEILDRRAQGAPTNRERDRFYFRNALATMERHFKSSDQPLFLYVQTMAAHSPYDSAYMPEENVPAGSPGTSAEMSEYLRRAAMAKRDGDLLMDEIKRRFPREPILVVRYGDHQPSATRDLINGEWGDESPEFREGMAPSPYITFYAMAGQNYPVPPLPGYDLLDIAYLGTVMLEAAGLPLSEAQRERKRLMAACQGRYFGCEPRSEILAFHRRLINSGLVRTP
jgi:phosphoglycerol transferase MdoB-like AlkP superfamily enzyme